MSVSALFVRSDSVYFGLCDAWDIARDASRYAGPFPVVAHPPCRSWGRYSHLAKPRPGERELALLAVDFVRSFGGVLEHPHASKLWRAAGLPSVGRRDEFGGFTLLVDQAWWGHPAPKPTWLYVVGREPESLPALPVSLLRPGRRVENLCAADRERTPEAFASFLVSVAQGCYVDLAEQGITPVVTSSWRLVA